MDKKLFMDKFTGRLPKDIKTATPQQLHDALGKTVMDIFADRWNNARQEHLSKRRAAYLSMEFLVGRAVYNNLLVLGIYDEVDEVFKELGIDLASLEEIEDAALGNGGLGRLAACFLDSAATLALPLDGYGIRYKYGLFKQSIVDGFQCEDIDDWTKYGDPWSVRCDEDTVLIVELAEVHTMFVIVNAQHIGIEPHFASTEGRMSFLAEGNGFDFELREYVTARCA